MKVTVIKEKCIGCGACQAIASEIYDMDNEGLAYVLVDVVPDELKDEATEALESCPTDAIEVVAE